MSDDLFQLIMGVVGALSVFFTHRNKKKTDAYIKDAEARQVSLEQALAQIAAQAANTVAGAEKKAKVAKSEIKVEAASVAKAVEEKGPAQAAAEHIKRVRARKAEAPNKEPEAAPEPAMVVPPRKRASRAAKAAQTGLIALLVVSLFPGKAHAACPESASVKKGQVVECDLECVDGYTMTELVERSLAADACDAEASLLRTTLEAKDKEFKSSVEAYEAALVAEREACKEALKDQNFLSDGTWLTVSASVLVLGFAGGFLLARD
jgi:hypothetical protein